MRMIMLVLLLSLVACGAAPQAAAPSEKPTVTEDTLATAVPAATAAQVAAPSEKPTVALPAATVTPEESLVPRMTSTAITQPTAHATRMTPVVDSVPTAKSSPAVVGEVPADLLDKILADAAQRSGVAAAAITVQMGQAVEWPDSSLGCPKPGVAYLQVITSGYHVLLLAGAGSYDYRADVRGRFFVCKS